jgi:hypothetical protein
VYFDEKIMYDLAVLLHHVSKVFPEGMGASYADDIKDI